MKPSKIKYTYTLVEAAALWAGIDTEEIQTRIDSNEQKKAELEHEQSIADVLASNAEDLALWKYQNSYCEFCKEPCPTWEKVQTADYDFCRLCCPEGFRTPPTATPPEPRPLPTRPEPGRSTMSVPGECADLPIFEERLSWLKEAAVSKDLPTNQDKVVGGELRDWLSRQFPHQRPSFLYPEQVDLEARLAYVEEHLERVSKEREELAEEVTRLRASLVSEGPVEGKSKSSYLNLIGGLLALVAQKDKFKTNDESIRNELRDIFGGDGVRPLGLSDSYLKTVFAEARRQVLANYPGIKNAFISKK